MSTKVGVGTADTHVCFFVFIYLNAARDKYLNVAAAIDNMHVTKEGASNFVEPASVSLLMSHAPAAESRRVIS